ncbi:MAG: hypothetical protein IPM29_17655 [Planctomycetes bacterium]|nr:hypothetical protein [Planctomycetota bacterium]
MRWTESTADGRIAFAGVQPGVWNVRPHEPPGVDTSPWFALPSQLRPTLVQVVGVAAATVTALSLDLRRGELARAAALSGRALLSERPSDRFGVRVDGEPPPLAVPDALGWFALGELPGCEVAIELRFEDRIVPVQTPRVPARGADGVRPPLLVDVVTGAVTLGLFDAEARPFRGHTIDLVRDDRV